MGAVRCPLPRLGFCIGVSPSFHPQAIGASQLRRAPQGGLLVVRRKFAC
jgi:hypothetical protein